MSVLLIESETLYICIIITVAISNMDEMYIPSLYVVKQNKEVFVKRKKNTKSCVIKAIIALVPSI